MNAEKPKPKTFFPVWPYALLPLAVGGYAVWQGRVLEGILGAALLALVVFWPRTGLERWLEDGKRGGLLLAVGVLLILSVIQNGLSLVSLVMLLWLGMLVGSAMVEQTQVKEGDEYRQKLESETAQSGRLVMLALCALGILLTAPSNPPLSEYRNLVTGGLIALLGQMMLQKFLLWWRLRA